MNVRNGYRLINLSNGIAVYLEIGSYSTDDSFSHPDIDLHVNRDDGYQRKEGMPFAKSSSRV
jgi:uncharacterized cupin superfamily protein